MLYGVVYAVIDEGSHPSPVQLHINAADLATAILRTKALAEYIDVVILGKIDDVGVGWDVDFSGWTLKPNILTGADIRTIGRFMFSDSTENEIAKLALATFNPSLVDSGGDVITTNPDVAALLSEVINGGWCTLDGIDVTKLKTAYLVEGGE